MSFRLILLLAALAAAGGCAMSASPHAVAASPAPADRFLAALAGYCGQAFAGRVVVDMSASATPGALTGKPLDTRRNPSFAALSGFLAAPAAGWRTPADPIQDRPAGAAAQRASKRARQPSLTQIVARRAS
ncbi:hypothetical protein [Xanthomonas sp. 3075]|uniref:hypothetical protein n=1 Tax=Xanthomonas sp. 3075 TaxID=3035315 RepID=UPI001C851F19|nr:hypothetical protein [Xanthomonas sp. 3075]